MPAYLYLLVGRVVPVDLGTLARTVLLFLILPFVLSAILQRWIIARRGRAFFMGPVKRLGGEVKLWALVLVIVAMFASQGPLGGTDLGRILLIIDVILGPIVELPILLFLSRVMLELRHRLWMSEPVGALSE